MFGIQIIWNGFPFGAIPGTNTFLPVQDFSLNTAAKFEEDEETGISKCTGRELQQCTFSIRAQSVAGADPRTVFHLLDLMKGQSGGIYLANGTASTVATSILNALQTSDWRKLFTLENAVQVGKNLLMGSNIGGCRFMLTAVTMDAQGITASGHVYDALITLSFTEDAAQNQTGGLRVYYNEKDITEQIAVAACYYDMHAEGEADSLILSFSDTKKQWENWKPSAEGDNIRITDGAVDSGKMYIDKVNPESGKYRICAYSTPKSAYTVKSRSFEGLSLPQLAQKIADEHKLGLKLFDVPETQTQYAVQKGQSDLAFLHGLCKRAGVSFIIYDGTLCLYGEKQMEAREPAKTITPGPKDEFKVTGDRHEAYSDCELRNGSMTGKATDPAVKTGKTYRETVQAAWATDADANAAAAARLRELNKEGKRAELVMSTQRQLAAGSVIKLDCTGWSGPAFIYRLRHDLLNKRSRLWVREPLNY